MSKDCKDMSELPVGPVGDWCRKRVPTCSNKNSKYFPSRDTPLWEKQKTSQKFQKYRLGAREVNIDGNHITYKKYDVDEGVKDGVNVRDIYRRVDLSQITEVYGSIK